MAARVGHVHWPPLLQALAYLGHWPPVLGWEGLGLGVQGSGH